MNNNNFFCGEESRQSGEDPIGTGDSYYQIYIFVEFPTPWNKDAFDTKSLPDSLKLFQAEISEQELPVKMLFIYSKYLWEQNFTKVLIYHRDEGLINRYHKQECQLKTIEEVVPVIKEYLLNGNFPQQTTAKVARDIFICTHGSHDKCCGKYGYPFYQQALANIVNLSFNDVRIWQTSHFGGHRFAPTVMDFPDGRYYARLNQALLTPLLTRTGEIDFFKSIYRGWSILPEPAQILEREMIFQHGWDWFDYKVIGTVLKEDDDGSFYHVEIKFQKPDGSLSVVYGDVVEDKSKEIYLIGDCDGKQTWKTPQFHIHNIVQMKSFK
jgi:hypothetical protein